MTPPASVESYNSQHIQEISDEEFHLLHDFVKKCLGFYWNHNKKGLIQNRLNSRLEHLGLYTYLDYYHHLISDAGKAEVPQMINAVTTNKTSFFREKLHCDYLEQTLLPQLREQHTPSHPAKFRFWSAGCSTGEEAYTLAMLIHSGIRAYETTPSDLRILATDVNTEALEQCKSGLYSSLSVEAIPPLFLQRYFQPKQGRYETMYEAHEVLKEMIQFRKVNFLDKKYPIKAKFNLIFCCNVMIYFDVFAQQQILQRLTSYLLSGGYLFIGSAEFIKDLPGCRRLKNSLYQKL